MKIKFLAPFLAIVALSFSLFYSCKKDDPTHPHPPTDSSNVVDLRKGLLLYLPFNGNFADSSGNNDTVTAVNGATLTSDQMGKGASALNGTGNGDCLMVTNRNVIKFDSVFSMSLNFMLNDVRRMMLISMMNWNTGYGACFGAGTDLPNVHNMHFGVVNSSADCSTWSLASAVTNDTSAWIPATSTWYNMTYIFNKGILQIYLNGQLLSSKAAADPAAHFCPTSQLLIGGWWSGDPVSLYGKMDEVRFYNRALNAGEIAKLAEGFPVQEPAPRADLKKGLLLYLPFNGSIADSSGNNNPTVAVNGASLTSDEHGYANSAFGANGGGQMIQVTNNGSIQFDTAFSVSLSVMSRDNALHSYLALTNFTTGRGPSFVLGTISPGYPNLTLGVVDQTTGCDNWGNGPGAHFMGDTTVFIPQAERWYNVVCTFHKGLAQTYVNGVLISSKQSAVNNVQLCPDAKLIVGGWWSQDVQNINGVIDNVRLYNRVLLPEEIALLATHYQPNANSARQTASGQVSSVGK